MKALATWSAAWPKAAPSSRVPVPLLHQQPPRLLGQMRRKLLVGHARLMPPAGPRHKPGAANKVNALFTITV